VPVRDTKERVVASLGVVVPNDDVAVRTVPALRAAAHGIQRAIAGNATAE
jgi:DNA-binding IclR family transcriptional regulator